MLSRQDSTDGTIKWLFDVGGGNAVETVFIPEDDRGTLCVSSQAGCAVGCRFCSTGHQGFSRNLTTGEILAQLWHAEHFLRKHLKTSERVISNVVMMGMGEPLQNYARVGAGPAGDAGRPWLWTVAPSRDGVDLGCGADDRSPGQDVPVALAVSLHAPTDALRDSLVPLNRKYPIAELMDACLRLPPCGAARFHHFRILHARWRQRPARACRSALLDLGEDPRGPGCALQDQPDSVQSVSGFGPQMFTEPGGSAFRPDSAWMAVL